jgi:hypothetical protein
MFGVQNQFLNSFMKMRRELSTAPPAKSPANKPGRNMPEVTKEISLRGIIEDKPKQKVVLDYFKSRIEELESEGD